MAPRRSFRRGFQCPKKPQCSSTISSRSDATTSDNRHQSTPRARNGIKFQSRATSLPSDLWTQLLPFLTWQDTNAMLCVCTEWKNVVTEAKTLYPEWRSTVLGPSANGSESLELLRTNHLNWADTRFVPDLILLSAASKDSSPWHSGGYWEEAIAAIEEARLLPPHCRIVGIFTMNAVLGTSEEEVAVQEGTEESSAVTLSVSVAHLVDTTVEMAEFDRKDLRRCHRGMELDNPFTTLENDMPSFLVFGVNDHSANQLVTVIEKWYPGAALVGAVSPLSDRCVPLATYCDGDAALGGRRLDRKKNRGTKQKSRRRPRPRSQVAFPSTMLLRLHGKVGIRSFSSSGYHPITPVIRCVRSSIAEELSQVVTHDLVSILNHEGSEDVTLHRVVDLLDPSERLAIEREGRGLNIFSCQDSAPLEHLLDCCANENKAPISNSAQIDRLEFVFWLQNSLMSLPGLGWREGAYGILASHHPTQTSPALAEALRSTQARLSLADERVFGAFMVAGALNEVEDLAHAKEIGQICAGIMRKSQLGGGVVSTSVGPVAFPGGVQTSAVRNIAQVQTHTTCGAVFYTKT